MTRGQTSVHAAFKASRIHSRLAADRVKRVAEYDIYFIPQRQPGCCLRMFGEQIEVRIAVEDDVLPLQIRGILRSAVGPDVAVLVERLSLHDAGLLGVVLRSAIAGRLLRGCRCGHWLATESTTATAGKSTAAAPESRLRSADPRQRSACSARTPAGPGLPIPPVGAITRCSSYPPHAAHLFPTGPNRCGPSRTSLWL